MTVEVDWLKINGLWLISTIPSEFISEYWKLMRFSATCKRCLVFLEVKWVSGKEISNERKLVNGVGRLLRNWNLVREYLMNLTQKPKQSSQQFDLDEGLKSLFWVCLMVQFLGRILLVRMSIHNYRIVDQHERKISTRIVQTFHLQLILSWGG